MNRIDKLVEIYNKWGHANGISPLPSADDLRFDGMAQVFLHYVNQNGPYREHAYDNVNKEK